MAKFTELDFQDKNGQKFTQHVNIDQIVRVLIDLPQNEGDMCHAKVWFSDGTTDETSDPVSVVALDLAIKNHTV